MRAQKDLAAVNDAIILEIDDDYAGNITLMMLAGGAGTVVIEGTMEDDPIAAGDWVALKVTNSTTEVVADNIAAPGMVYAKNPGYNRVRARKTVGVASCPCILGVSRS